jgi:DeoR family deoxyribose operon repressor
MGRNRGDEGGARRREDRLARLRGAVADGSMLRLRKAARLLGVSEMTVRRDLAAGASQLACLGGYVFRAETPGTAPRYALDAENASHILPKQEAARRAAALIEPGDTIFVDCGTTTPHLAAALPAGHLTVICYALNIAEIVCRRADTQLVLLGGLYHPSSATFYGEEALAQLRRLGIAKAFISAGGIDFERGVSCSHFHEVPIKQAAMSHARHSYLVADSSKFGQLRPAAFARLDAFERVLTDDGLSAADRARLEDVARERAGSVPGRARARGKAGARGRSPLAPYHP